MSALSSELAEQAVGAAESGVGRGALGIQAFAGLLVLGRGGQGGVALQGRRNHVFPESGKAGHGQHGGGALAEGAAGDIEQRRDGVRKRPDAVTGSTGQTTRATVAMP